MINIVLTSNLLDLLIDWEALLYNVCHPQSFTCVSAIFRPTEVRIKSPSAFKNIVLEIIGAN